MVILDLEVLDIVLKKIVENIKYQKDAQRNSVQKEVLNSSPSFFSASLVKKTLIRTSPPLLRRGGLGPKCFALMTLEPSPSADIFKNPT